MTFKASRVKNERHASASRTGEKKGKRGSGVGQNVFSGKRKL